MDGQAIWEALVAYVRRVHLYWTDRPRWRQARCAAGHHELLSNWRDAHHFTEYCRWCPYRHDDESWGE